MLQHVCQSLYGQSPQVNVEISVLFPAGITKESDNVTDSRRHGEKEKRTLQCSDLLSSTKDR